MLKRSNLKVESKADVRDPEEEVLDFKKIFFKLADKWIYIAVCLIIGIVIAAFLNRYTTPVYVVESSLLIKEPKEITNAVSDLLYGDEMFGRNATNLDNESILLKSYALIETTLRDLKLDVSYFHEGDIHNIELYKKSPIRVDVLPSKERVLNNVMIRCVIKNDEVFTLEPVEKKFTLKKNKKIERLKELLGGQEFEFGKEVDIKGYKFIIHREEGENKQRLDVVIFNILPYDRLTKVYRKSLSIEPLGENSTILNVSIEGPTPDKLKDFLNKHVENYIFTELEKKNDRASKTIDFIDNQILYMGDSLNVAETRLESFKKSSSVTMSSDGTALYAEIQQFEKEKAALELKNNYLSDLRNFVSQNDVDQIIVPSSIGINDPTLNSATNELVTLQTNIRVIESNGRLDNPLILKNKKRVEALKGNILQSVASLKDVNDLQINSLRNTINRLRANVRRLPTAERQLINIQRNYDLNEDLYLFLMTKKAEAGIIKASNSVDYSVIDGAVIKGTLPVKPSPVLNYTMGIILGLMIPALLIIIIDALNNKVRSKEEILKLTSIPLLGVVAKNKEKVDLINENMGNSTLIESFRTVRSNLRYLVGSKSEEGQILLVTSTISGEGKTFCSNNLAYIFSNYGKRVLLVDCDMRKVKDHLPFKPKKKRGLSDYLAGMVSKDEIIQTTDYDNLFMITAGGVPPNPTELIMSEMMSNFLKEVRMEFDYIILDTPPMGIISDSLELMDKSDVNILIARQNYTLKKYLTEANNLYSLDQETSNFTILFNDVKIKDLHYGDYFDKKNGSSTSSIFLKKKKNLRKVEKPIAS
ncbi:polysaccharide biosynthesis tyrosine autokinase [Fulvivirgaceae bacterium BMA10]|uniref:non-specific protein-tyrosine kinase n=1 Tax=Splendidivirga corallicola TaxID=3051826 RepID=A0ABT8KXB9_9BACT|nr:polysaccharide biosynthesis tyrosine autokinase [Fulvivirgaceae bacterium BMA10]